MIFTDMFNLKAVRGRTGLYLKIFMYGSLAAVTVITCYAVVIRGVPAAQDMVSGPVTTSVTYVKSADYDSYRHSVHYHHSVVILQAGDGKTLRFDLGNNPDLEQNLATAKEFKITYYPRSNIFVSYSK